MGRVILIKVLDSLPAPEKFEDRRQVERKFADK